VAPLASATPRAQGRHVTLTSHRPDPSVGALRVLLTDQGFKDSVTEREKLAAIGATLDVADGSSAAIRERGRTADAILTTYAPLNRAMIESFERCRVIARYGIGVDNIDLDAARERGVVVTNVPDYCVEEVADHTLALLLAAVRKIVKGNEVVRAAGWGTSSLTPIHRMRGRTLGLLGYGNIASRVARRARAFGLQIAAHDPFVSRTGSLPTTWNPLQPWRTCSRSRTSCPFMSHSQNTPAA
jgi:D-3-phosphoglycerate dehydrogenase